jgi:hypothetical protein
MQEVRKEGGDPGALHIFMPLVKVDVAKREVWGVVTAEVPDKEDEVCDYDTTVPYYKALVDEMSKATDGVNIFPLREMHGLSAAGKGISIEFREGTKEVFMGFKVVDDAAWKKVEECVYTGFSQGGRYIKKWQDGAYVKYTAKPSEVSLVDLPCLTRAHFDYVKADGTVEKRAFKKEAEIPTAVGALPATPTPVNPVAPVDLSLVAAKETVTIPSEEEKVAIEAGKAEKAKYITDNQDRVGKSIKEVLVDVINDRAFGQLDKGMYSVSCFAEIIEQLKYLWLSLEYEREVEGDESPATDDVKEIFSNLLAAFLSYAEEQVEELTANAAAFEGGLAMATEAADLEKAARISMSSHFKKAASHHEHIAATHEKMTKAHDGAAAHHEEMMRECMKADSSGASHHKIKASFHKSMANHHVALTKRHNAHAEHLHKMAASCAAEDATKVLKLATIEEGELMETVDKTIAVVPPVVNVASAAIVNEDFGKLAAAQTETNNLLKALIEKMSAPAPVVAPEVNVAAVAVDNKGVEAAKRAAEILTNSGPIARSFPVPRTGDMTKAGGIDKDSVPPQFAHLVGIEHVE